MDSRYLSVDTVESSSVLHLQWLVLPSGEVSLIEHEKDGDNFFQLVDHESERVLIILELNTVL